jgi:hypothetical protein
MITLFIRFVPALIAAFVLLVGMIRAQPYDDGDLRELLDQSGCWQGICIGVTTRQDALRLLQASEWVGEIFQADLHISWHWSGRQSPLIDASQDGLLGVSSGVVRQLRVRTSVPFGAVWLLLSHPDDALLVRPFSRYNFSQIAMYDQLGMQAITTVVCPVNPLAFWKATTTLGFGDLWQSETIDGYNFDVYDTSFWWDNLRRCRP